jgi:hypothetical protein
MNSFKIFTAALVMFLLQACCVLGTRSTFETGWNKQGVSAADVDSQVKSCSEKVNNACISDYTQMCTGLLRGDKNILVNGKTVKEMTGIRTLESTLDLCARKDEVAKKMAHFCGTPKINTCMTELGFKPVEVETKECRETLPI